LLGPKIFPSPDRVACRNPRPLHGILKNEIEHFPEASRVVCLEIEIDGNVSETDTTRNRLISDSYEEYHLEFGTLNQPSLQEVKHEFPRRNCDTYFSLNVH
jgi:hypothetical protein